MTLPPPIGPDDAVSVRGRYLVKQDGSRFLMKGLAFPVPPAPKEHQHAYDAQGWIAILQQLRDLNLEINTVRIYQMDPLVDYEEFFLKAASLGFYVLVPLTAASGNGVMDRTLSAPHCYPKKLYDYGKACIDNYAKYPNVLGGVIANEIMNSLQSWKAAPCIQAYARDLKLYSPREFPLVYAAQHDGIGAVKSPADTMKLTLEFLTCNNQSSIDVFGINVESWCSSQQTFERNPSGSIGTYYELWQALHNTTIPLIFSEMGCSKHDFNKDNDLEKGTRDWKQVPIVLKDMADTWSGFCAYVYDGNRLFDMMQGGPWDGHDPLEPTDDFYNFRKQLSKVRDNSSVVVGDTQDNVTQPACPDVRHELRECCNLDLYSADGMKSYYKLETKSIFAVHPVLVAGFGLAVVAILSKFISHRLTSRQSQARTAEEGVSLKVDYESIN